MFILLSESLPPTKEVHSMYIIHRPDLKLGPRLGL